MDLRKNCDKNVRQAMMNIHISMDHPSFLAQCKEGISWYRMNGGGIINVINSFGRDFFFGGKKCHLTD
jgi:hypothetical protein